MEVPSFEEDDAGFFLLQEAWMAASGSGEESAAVGSTYHEWRIEEEEGITTNDHNNNHNNLVTTTTMPKEENDVVVVADRQWIHDLSSQELLERLQKRCRPEDIPQTTVLKRKKRRRLTCTFLQYPTMMQRGSTIVRKKTPTQEESSNNSSSSWNNNNNEAISFNPEWDDLVLIPTHETQWLGEVGDTRDDDDVHDALFEWILLPHSIDPNNNNNQDEIPTTKSRTGNDTKNHCNGIIGNQNGGNHGKAKFVEDDCETVEAETKFLL